LISGGLSGACEILVTYPTEYIKTQLQLDQKKGLRQYSGPLDCTKKTIQVAPHKAKKKKEKKTKKRKKERQYISKIHASLFSVGFSPPPFPFLLPRLMVFVVSTEV